MTFNANIKGVLIQKKESTSKPTETRPAEQLYDLYLHQEDSTDLLKVRTDKATFDSVQNGKEINLNAKITPYVFNNNPGVSIKHIKATA